MGDWERIFGAGVSAETVIDRINNTNRREHEFDDESYDNQKMWFSTFQEALAWTKSNPGKAIVRSPDGEGFVEK